MLDIKYVIEFFILGLMSGITGIPPRHSEDWGLMMVMNFDRNTDNYYEKDKFIFNKYKTSKVYGKVEVNVKQMAPQMNDFIKNGLNYQK